MNKEYDTYIPEGFHTLNSYLFVKDAEAYITFLKAAFGAVEKSRTMDDTNTIVRNVILMVGNSSFMISESSDHYPAMTTAFYVYMADADAAMAKAIECGATLELEAMDMPYGDRQGGVRDPAGNIWWIATRLVHQYYAD